MSEDFETRSIDQLEEATAASANAVVAIQEPGGQAQKIKVERLFRQVVAAGAVFEEEADAQSGAGLDFDEHTIGLVYGDPDPDKSGWYRKVGASGEGNWSQFEALAANILPVVEDARDTAVAAAETVSGTVSSLAGKYADGGFANPEAPLAKEVILGDVVAPLAIYDRPGDLIHFGRPVLALREQLYQQRTTQTAFTFADINQTIGYGQSLSSGDEVPGIVTSTAEFPDKVVMFSEGIKPDVQLATAGAVSPDSPSAFTGREDAVEDMVKTAAAFSEAGETPLSGAANLFAKMLIANGDYSKATLPVQHVSSAGVGSNDIDQLLKTPVPVNKRYANRLVNHWTSCNSIASGLTETHKVDTILFCGLEADVEQGGETRSGLVTKLDSLCASIDTDVKALTSQAESPIIVAAQTSYKSATAAKAALALFDWQDHETKFLACPQYFFAFDPHDKIHPMPQWQRIMGHYMGRVRYHVLVKNRRWTGLKPVAAWAEGTNVFVRFLVPCEPLAIDVEAFGTITGNGFRIFDDGGDKTVSDVSVHDATTIRIAINSALASTNPTIRYALDYVRVADQFSPLASMGAGNIRDSEPEKLAISGSDEPFDTFNWAQAFELDIDVLATEVS